MVDKKWMIYGANGYTGELIARESKNKGLNPVLAGRSAKVISLIASDLHLPSRIFSLDKHQTVVDNLKDIHTVLYCAGPFSKTSNNLIEACLETHTNYIDITGEIDVFELLNTYTNAAIQHQIAILPGMGFDVVPTDCLALKLKKLLPDATTLTLAFFGQGGQSKGTRKTVIESLKSGAKIRINGKIKKVPFAYKTREITFKEIGKQTVVLIPWGDVSTAYYSTNIPNIEVYMCMLKRGIKQMKRYQHFGFLFSFGVFENFLKKRIDKTHVNPSEEVRSKTKSFIYGEVSNTQGKSCTLELVTPNGYNLTILTALAAVEKTLSNTLKPGFYTPSMAFGEDFILQIEGKALK